MTRARATLLGFSFPFAWLVPACTPAASDSLEPSTGGSANAPDGALPEPRIADDRPILFVSTRGGAASSSAIGGQLFVTNADGADAMRLHSERSIYDPVWSPDGSAVAVRRPTSTAGGFTSRFELLLANGTERVVLFEEDEVTSEFENGRPHGGISWSSDGETLALASSHASDHLRIWLSATSGGRERLALPNLDGPHYSPSFSPVAPDTLAYVDGTHDVWLVDLAASSEPRNLTAGEVDAFGGLRWAPSGDRLTFAAFPPGVAEAERGFREIYVLELGSLELTRVTENAADDLDPSFSPDGSSLLIASDRDSRDPGVAPSGWLRDLFIVPLDSPGAAVNVTSGSSGDDAQGDWFWPRSGI